MLWKGLVMALQSKQTDTYLKQIWVDCLDEIDRKCLQKAVDASYYGHEVGHILADVQENFMQLWRGAADGKRFVIITQVFSHPGGKELRIWSVGGEGYIRAIETSYATLCEFAKKYHCKWITGLVNREGFERLYKKFNFTETYRNWIVELDDEHS